MWSQPTVIMQQQKKMSIYKHTQTGVSIPACMVLPGMVQASLSSDATFTMCVLISLITLRCIGELKKSGLCGSFVPCIWLPSLFVAVQPPESFSLPPSSCNHIQFLEFRVMPILSQSMVSRYQSLQEPHRTEQSQANGSLGSQLMEKGPALTVHGN